MYSEKELIREFEKVASTLVPEKDWSVRIAAMQRVEGLVFGGLYQFFSFSLVYDLYLRAINLAKGPKKGHLF